MEKKEMQNFFSLKINF